MSRPSRLAAVLFNTEASWADQSVSTFGTRLTVTNEVDVSRLLWTKFDPSRVVQLRNEITPKCQGYLGGEIDTEFAVTGLGSTAAGTITLTAMATILGLVLGNAVAGRTAALTATAAGTATAWNVSVATGQAAGSLVRAGVLNDGRGNGQWAQVVSHATSIMTVANGSKAALTAGDVIYNAANIYGSESPTANDITSARMRFLTANQQYDVRGAFPKKIVFTGFAVGGEPKFRVTWGVSVWAEISVAFPDATSFQTFPTIPVAAGSFFFAPYGTPARAGAEYIVRDFTLTYDLGVVPMMGPGAGNPNQSIVGAKRTQDNISFSFVDDSEATTTTPLWKTRSVSNGQFHFLWSMACVDGSAFCVRAPCVYLDDVPTQKNVDNLNRVPVTGRCGADNTKTTDLERSALVLGVG